jgi:hypothetical protein
VWASVHNTPSAIRKDPQLQFRVPGSSLRLPNYKSPNMPADWRPDKSLQDFIKETSHSRQTEQRERHEGRVFNNEGHIREPTIRNNQRDIYEIEGSLVVQRQLLFKLAEQENWIIDEPGRRCESSVERLESLKTDTVQAIQKTWGQSSRSTAKKRSLYPLW